MPYAFLYWKLLFGGSFQCKILDANTIYKIYLKRSFFSSQVLLVCNTQIQLFAAYHFVSMSSSEISHADFSPSLLPKLWQRAVVER